ncbi:MAG: DUF2071 domain-containing protein [Ignavibacteria bacterium]|nr:DUF2071 domain-containing protein [Ignavibacteria bacterium]
MTGEKVFLSARWENLVLVTYSVKPEALEAHMPKGLTADTIDGNAFVSLVAFDFLETRIKGIKVPYHVNFPEINLRFYVKNKEKRGVVFIREFVPRAAIPLVANLIYNEKYKAIKMTSSIAKKGTIFLNHAINYNKKNYSIDLEAENNPQLPAINSTEHFFKEHEWGFGTSRDGKPLVYRVEHPFWDIYPIIKFKHDFDFGAIYGAKWDFLNLLDPYNITFAKGSEVKVFSGKELK